MEVFHASKVDVVVGDVTGTKENRSSATKLAILGAVAVANFQHPLVEQLLK